MSKPTQGGKNGQNSKAEEAKQKDKSADNRQSAGAGNKSGSAETAKSGSSPKTR
jgi:hypothetical protein